MVDIIALVLKNVAVHWLGIAFVLCYGAAPFCIFRRDRSVSVGLFPGNLDRQQLCTSQMAADA